MIKTIDTDLNYVVSGHAVKKIIEVIKLLDIRKLSLNGQIDVADRLRTVIEEMKECADLNDEDDLHRLDRPL